MRFQNNTLFLSCCFAELSAYPGVFKTKLLNSESPTQIQCDNLNKSHVRSSHVLSSLCNSLQWSHNGNDVSNHWRLHCLLNRLFRRRWRKASKLQVTGLYEGNSPVTSSCLHPLHCHCNLFLFVFYLLLIQLTLQQTLMPYWCTNCSISQAGFHYFGPFLLTCTASLADLNSRLEDPIDMKPFRANIVVDTSKAFDEVGFHVAIANKKH